MVFAQTSNRILEVGFAHESEFFGDFVMDVLLQPFSAKFQSVSGVVQVGDSLTGEETSFADIGVHFFAVFIFALVEESEFFLDELGVAGLGAGKLFELFDGLEERFE